MLLYQVVAPALFWKFGRKVVEQGVASGASQLKDEQMLRTARGAGCRTSCQRDNECRSGPILSAKLVESRTHGKTTHL
jgi:hypothetical protein